jgi:hypothetical protein
VLTCGFDTEGGLYLLVIGLNTTRTDSLISSDFAFVTIPRRLPESIEFISWEYPFFADCTVHLRARTEADVCKYVAVRFGCFTDSQLYTLFILDTQ